MVSSVQHDINTEVVILGGGFAGLATAYYLGRAGYDCVVVEKSSTLGGLASTFSIENTRLEKYYHHMFTTDQHLYSLINDLGLVDQFIKRKSTMALYSNGEFFKFNSPLDLLRCTAMNFFDRIRFGLATLVISKRPSSKALDKVTAISWLRSIYGKNITKLIWEPLLRSKFGKEVDHVSAAWIFERIAKRADSREKGGTREALIYPVGSYQILFDKIIEKIKLQNNQLLCNTTVEHLLFDNSGRVNGIHTSLGDIRARQVVATIPTPLLLNLFSGHQTNKIDDESRLLNDLCKNLRQIRYQASVVVILKCNRRLFPYYWINIADEEFPFSVIVAHTELVPSQDYGNKHIYYIGAYTSPNSSLYKTPDREVLSLLLPYLFKLNSSMEVKDIEQHYVFRSIEATPVFTTGFYELMPPIKSPIEGLYLCTNTQIYPYSRNLDSTLRLVRATVDAVVSAT